MAKIKIKNSVTPGLAPSGLSFGEMAVNIVDKKIFIGNAVEGVVTLHDQQNVVTSINGSTGAITNVARTNEGNTFSVRQVMNAGISAANLNVTSGATFTTISSSSTTDCVDILASTNGIGLRVAQNIGGGAATIGGIRLGRSTTTASNYLLYAASGTFYLINGTGGSDPQLMSLNSIDANFNVPIRGATFSSTAGQITVQKSSYVGSDSGTVRIVGVDALSNPYNSDIRANASAAANTTHTLPAVTGTLLNTTSSYVVSVNGSTGAITNVAKTNTTQTFTQLQDFSAGISASTGTNVIDVIATTDGCGLRIAQAASGSNARIGGIQLGRGSSNTANSYIENYVGQLNFFNGISGTSETPGTNMLQLSTTSAIFGVPIAGATFSGLIRSTSGISASGGITTGSYIYAESGFRVGSGAINSQTGTAYTLLAADNGEIIVWNTSAGATLTIPSGLPVGFNATLIQTGTAAIGITGSGTTLNSFEGKLRTAGQHAAVSIISYSSNVFNVAGGLTA
jgi:hypothetical protein